MFSSEYPFIAFVATGPIKLLTTANSIRERNTNTEQDDIQTSIALTYETGGSDCCDWVFWVARVSSEVTPRVTRAGIASGFIQNDIQDMTTIRAEGM